MDGLTGSMLFNTVAIMGFLLVPQAYSTMFPREIKTAAAPYVDRKDVRTMNLILYPLYPVLFAWWGISSHFSGVSGFRQLFWTGYIEMTFVSVTDFLILDCWLPRRVRHMIKGAENCKAWERREWMKTLAIPEHGLIWTFIVCPIAGLAVAGIASIFG